jgi:arylsulfatase A-like enzyme
MKYTTRRELLGSVVSAAAAFAAPSRPNFLFLCPDQHRFDWMSGNERIPIRTPNLDSVAARGVRFAKVTVAAPVCAPSRACLAAGKEYDNCGVAGNSDDYPIEQKTYYSLLRDSGYHVAACGKLDLNKGSHFQGLDGRVHMEDWGFSDMINNAGKGDAISHGAENPTDPYMAYLHQQGLAATYVADLRKRVKEGYQATWPTTLPEDAYCDNWIGGNALQLMNRFPKGKPWHLVVNFAGPHDPEDITARMEKSCRGRRFLQPNGSSEFNREIHNRIRQNYTAMVENIDRWAGILIEQLKSRGELDNTVIIYSSDHGEMLGDHNRWHKAVPYEASVCVPLVIAGPGVRAGLRSDALVSHIDIGATILDYAGVAKPRDMQSLSLRSLLEGKTRRHRDFVRSGLGNWRMVYDGRYKLIRGFDPAETRPARLAAGAGSRDVPPLLFDLHSDPLENRDIAGQAPEVMARISKLFSPGATPGTGHER